MCARVHVHVRGWMGFRGVRACACACVHVCVRTGGLRSGIGWMVPARLSAGCGRVLLPFGPNPAHPSVPQIAWCGPQTWQRGAASRKVPRRLRTHSDRGRVATYVHSSCWYVEGFRGFR